MKKSKAKVDKWFEESLEPHVSMIRGWLSSRYGDIVDVDDVVQEALLRVVQVWNEGDVKAPKAYFFAVARNLAYDRMRRRRVLTMEPVSGLEDFEFIYEDESVEETAERNHDLEILTEAIQTLPDRCRQAFTLSKVYGMTYHEIAKEMGVSVNTVATQIAQGLSRCTRYIRSMDNGMGDRVR